MNRSTERILTSHVGALHRPDDLAQMLLKEWTGDAHDADALDERLRGSVAEVVGRQIDVGIDVINDGEFSKSTWMAYPAERMTGIEISSDPAAYGQSMGKSQDRTLFADFYREAGAQTWYVEPGQADVVEEVRRRILPVCTGPITYSGQRFIQRDIENLKAALGGADSSEAFLAVAGPGSVQPFIKNEHYPDDESFLEALADALHEEYKAIIDAGLICQVDDAFLPFEYDRRLAEDGWDFQAYRRWAEMTIAAVNRALDGLPEDRLRYHICWGSWNGPHVTDVPLKDIVDLILQVNAQTYAIEASNARHEWEWLVWEDVKLPEGKILMPGVIEHTTHVVEHPETVAQRIIRFADVVGKENVIAGTDCGFRNRSHPQVAWAKLDSLVKGAELASARLYGK